jgi:NitT/TauT family transport system substrate-binding protein
MRTQHARRFSRRRFLGGVTLAGAAGLLGLHARPVAAEPPSETTTLRLVKVPSICQAPQYVAEELIKSEGFTEVIYIQKDSDLGIQQALASGEADLSNLYGGPLILRVEAGDPVVILAGLHVGCFELVGTDQVRAIRDLKGKTVAVPALGTSQHVYLSSMMAYVGLDPRTDVTWVTHSLADAVRLLTEEKLDAFLATPPATQELRAKGIGHVVVNSTLDRPWSQYFCCMMAGNREFVRKHPMATKRALRAILKANQLCALEPEQAATFLVERGFTPSYDYAVQTLREIPYARWREYDPEDTIRFYALRLHEAGMIKSTPQKIIARGTNWRFLNELKKELKG